MKDRIKIVYQYLKHKITWIYQSIKRFFTRRYEGTQPGVIKLLKALTSALLSVLAVYSVSEKIPVAVMAVPLAILIYLLLTLLIKLLHCCRKVVQRYETGTIVTVMIFFSVLTMIMRMGDTSEDTVMVIGVIVVLVELLFARSLWSIVRGKRRYILNFLILAITTVINVAGCILIFGEGFGNSYRDRYLAMKQQTDIEKIPFEEEPIYTVQSLEYGTTEEASIQTGTTNLQSFTSYNGEWTKKLREYYWGHGIDKVPLSGKIWYPEGQENCPVLFIIHGNHTMVTESYLGYGYLGEYLASRGYVVVSVDQSFCNGYIDQGLIEENDARAILLLDNIKEILRQNHDKDSVLYRKIDEENIAIAGHSRGGEAVSVAALFNEYDVYPDNGRVKFDYHFNIKTVIAIAPTCGQYEPGDREVQLQDINYFLIHGSNDMDVTEFMGMKQYENVTFSGEGDYRKAYLYVEGANHGQFNTEWGRYDTGFPAALFLNTASLIDEKQQQEILETYLYASLELTLKNRAELENFFVDASSYDSILADTVEIQGYENSSFEVICDYEEDSIIDQGSIEGSNIFASNLTWMERYVPFTDISENVYGDRDNYAVRLNWNKTLDALYAIDLSNATIPEDDYRFLQFDVLNYDDEASEDDVFQPIDFTIVIKYEDGTMERKLLSDYMSIYPPIAVQLSKLDVLMNQTVYKHHFQTVQIPLETSGVKVSNIRFVFNQMDEGLILVDNIGLTK